LLERIPQLIPARSGDTFCNGGF